ncbi:uncharacterized protein LY89DRAFT_589052 [Mollisia scopiformis]|uniref:CENP-V/GFA domain-containing protein n=1 Tax=Mollisia scopiformis TaxID=149040 RepID=A0A194X4R6_MOLSC|nr:uncharacterized protein LY89DRAFT_589052 [Mollisia scopiformis]KUJ15059.1 hypothetical protein LY89DRAFT_589052 [Mollisia scopiformis]
MAHPLLSNPFSKDTSNNIVNGSCLCGAITFTLTGAPSTTVLCHCLSCKKSSGSAFQANGFYENSQLTLSPDSTAAMKTYTDKSCDSSGTVDRVFCSTCGSRLFNRNPKYKDALIVNSGVLDLGDEGWREWKP